MTENKERIGNFTSSEIWKLMKNGKVKDSFGVPALTYIEEKKMERRLGRSIDLETNAHPLSWGKLMEQRIFDLLGIEYKLSSEETVTHPTIKFWSGSPDGSKSDEGGTTVEFKCPITMKSFCQLVDPLHEGLTGMDAMNAIRERHDKGEDYYWQTVSNAVLQNHRYGELIVYCPYLSELQDIKDYASEVDIPNPSRYFWINSAQDNELPYLVDDGYYRNINIIRFEIPDEDKSQLTARVLKAGDLLGVPTVIARIKEVDKIVKQTV